MPPQPYYPRGKIRADDEGQTTIALAIQDGTLIMAFPKPIKWLGLGPDDLEKFIAGLQEKLELLRKTGA